MGDEAVERDVPDMGVIERAESEFGGDAACWLDRVCDDCGALVEGQPPAVCWRCGKVLASA